MKLVEAEKIINEFGSWISSGEDEIVYPISRLKVSKGQIRIAFETYVKGLIENGMLTAEIQDSLEVTYGLIEKFVDDSQAELINLGFKNKTSESVKNYMEYNRKSVNATAAFSKYIEHCKENRGQYPEIENEYCEEALARLTSNRSSHTSSNLIAGMVGNYIGKGLLCIIIVGTLLQIFGNEQIGSIFRKPYIETEYWVNVYDTIDDPYPTRQEALIRDTLFEGTWIVYMSYNQESDIEFEENGGPYRLKANQKIRVPFYFYETSEEEYKYVELTLEKSSGK